MKSTHDIRMGLAIVQMMQACDMYATAYYNLFESHVGDDGVLGDALADILRGCELLLNGPIGRESGGDLHKRILKIAEMGQLLDKNGEIKT